MTFPVPHLSVRFTAEPPPAAALVQAVAREDASWGRPVFRAPPLELQPATFDAARVTRELRHIGLVER